MISKINLGLESINIQKKALVLVDEACNDSVLLLEHLLLIMNLVSLTDDLSLSLFDVISYQS